MFIYIYDLENDKIINKDLNTNRILNSGIDVEYKTWYMSEIWLFDINNDGNQDIIVNYCSLDTESINEIEDTMLLNSEKVIFLTDKNSVKTLKDYPSFDFEKLKPKYCPFKTGKVKREDYPDLRELN